MQAQVPIVPVVCANYAHVLDVKKKIFTPGTVSVTVLPPVPTKGMSAADVDALVEKTRERMLEEIVRLSHVSGEGDGEPLPRKTVVQDGAELRKRN